MNTFEEGHAKIDEHGKKATAEMIVQQEKLMPVIDKIISVVKAELKSETLTTNEIPQVLGKCLAYVLEHSYDSKKEFRKALGMAQLQVSDMISRMPQSESYISQQSLLMLASQIPDHTHYRKLINACEDPES